MPFTSSLDWSILGAVPEMLQTSHGSLTIGLDAQPGQSILIRGGTSSIGMATTVLAKQRGMTVLATTRNRYRIDILRGIGVDHVLVDDGRVADQARRIFSDGVDTALELVGTPTLPDTLRAPRVHGVVCFTGMLSNQWTVRDFYPIEYLPRGVRLTAYGGDATDLPNEVLQDFLDAVATGDAACQSIAPTASPTSPRRMPTWKPDAPPANSSCCHDHAARWAEHGMLHRTGAKVLHHVVVGQLDASYRTLGFPSDPGQWSGLYGSHCQLQHPLSQRQRSRRTLWRCGGAEATARLAT